MRRDARARRDALLAAAAASFAERGYGIPLEDVAARAGVGRGTLYRNFADREALALAIFERDVDEVDAIVARNQNYHQSMLNLALAGRRSMTLFARIAIDLVANTENMAAFEALGERLARSLAPLAARARATGEVRDDVDGAMLALALRMVGGLSHNPDAHDRAMQELQVALELVMRGLKP